MYRRLISTVLLFALACTVFHPRQLFVAPVYRPPSAVRAYDVQANFGVPQFRYSSLRGDNWRWRAPVVVASEEGQEAVKEVQEAVQEESSGVVEEKPPEPILSPLLSKDPTAPVRRSTAPVPKKPWEEGFDIKEYNLKWPWEKGFDATQYSLTIGILTLFTIVKTLSYFGIINPTGA